MELTLTPHADKLLRGTPGHTFVWYGQSNDAENCNGKNDSFLIVDAAPFRESGLSLDSTRCYYVPVPPDNDHA